MLILEACDVKDVRRTTYFSRSGLRPHVRPFRYVCLVRPKRRPGNGRKQTMTVTPGATQAAMHTVLATSLGELTGVQEEGAVTGLYFPRHWPRPDKTAFGPRSDEGFEEVARQLGEYLDGERSAFDLRLTARGSEFDRRVWELID